MLGSSAWWLRRHRHGLGVAANQLNDAQQSEIERGLKKKRDAEITRN
jgi:hypothetical protein